jgi:hypothetical protein
LINRDDQHSELKSLSSCSKTNAWSILQYINNCVWLVLQEGKHCRQG